MEIVGKKNGTQQSVYASYGGRVKVKVNLYITFRHVGQDAASSAAAVINTGRCQQCRDEKK